ncbi:MAG: translocation/assembly module TamB domain-containing protein [Bacteroidaceae bacterium]|nr:translocation/assembly module TamB domain-containing protein [Bacteroidaceae bacterium]
MKKALIWIGIILLSPVFLFLLVTILLYIPPIQQGVVNFVAKQVSEQTGYEVKVDYVRVAFPLDAVVHGMDAKKDGKEMLHVESLTADVKLWPLIAHSYIDLTSLEVNEARFNTLSVVDQCVAEGSIHRAYFESHGVKLDSQTVNISDVLIDKPIVTITMADSVPEDTTVSEPTKWKIHLSDAVVNDMRVKVNFAKKDSMWVGVGMGSLAINDAYIDLENGLYNVDAIAIKNGGIDYDSGTPTALDTIHFDYNHIALRKMFADIRNVKCSSLGDVSLDILGSSLTERCGLKVDSLELRLRMDSNSVHIPGLQFVTPYSNGQMKLDMDYSAFDVGAGGNMSARAMIQLGRGDVLLFSNMLPRELLQNYPHEAIYGRVAVDGNVDRMRYAGLNLGMRNHFWLKADGELRNLMDDKRRVVTATFKADAPDLRFVMGMLPADIRRNYALPSMAMSGRMEAKGDEYNANVDFREGNDGHAVLTGHYNGAREDYDVNLTVERIQLRDFMPHDTLGAFSGELVASGHGFDFYSPRTTLSAKGGVNRFELGHYNVDNIRFEADYRANNYDVNFISRNDLLMAKATAKGEFRRSRVTTDAQLDVERADMKELRMTEKMLDISLRTHFAGFSDFKDLYSLRGNVSMLQIVTPDLVLSPENVDMRLEATPDTIYAYAQSGDLLINFTSSEGVTKLADKGMELYEQVMKQIENREIDDAKLRKLMPQMALHIELGRDNPLSDFLASQSLSYDNVFADINVSPIDGINGRSHVFSLKYDSTLIDTIRFNLSQDTVGLTFDAQVRNNRYNPQFVFNALANGSIHSNGADVKLRLYDAHNKKGIDVGAEVCVTDSGYYCHLFPKRPLIAYREFNLNDDNFILIGHNSHVTADVSLLTDDGMGVKLYSTPNSDALQDITASFSKFDLADITSVIPYSPRMTGMLNGDARLLQTTENMSVLSDMSVDHMTYEGCPLGNISSEFVYLPKDADTHHVNGRIMKEGVQICSLDGTYFNRGEGEIDATLKLEKCPLELVNGFIPDQMFGMSGNAEGTMSVQGAVNRPVVNGEVLLDSAYVSSDYYGFRFRFEKKPIVVDRSSLTLTDYHIYSGNGSSLAINGSVNFSNLDRIYTNIRMRAHNFELVNNQYNRKALVYGKVYVDYGGYVRGYLDDMVMRGRLSVLDKTDVTYVLRDTPLTVEDRLDGLVTFTDFSRPNDEAEEEKSGHFSLDMLLTINIADGVRAKCDLSSDRSSYVNLEGGGTLTMEYTPQQHLTLAGRYTLNNGEMKYALPVIPLKTFTIHNGSYIEFTGDPMNPRLNIAASERVRSSVVIDENPQNVSFDVGVAISNTLQNLGLEFTLEAPENMTVQNQLAAMSSEERGKLAVTMLCTGLYLAEGNTGGFTMTNALNSFLQSEINNIAGNALKSVDLSVDMEDGTKADGTTSTDFAFKFAKRFWGNRLSVVIGGKVSTGSQVQNENQTFINNISLEWRLDNSASRYVRLFYDRNYASILEGEITEMGVGLVLRKKMTRFGELFVFGNKNKNQDIMTLRNRPSDVEKK